MKKANPTAVGAFALGAIAIAIVPFFVLTTLTQHKVKCSA